MRLFFFQKPFQVYKETEDLDIPSRDTRHHIPGISSSGRTGSWLYWFPPPTTSPAPPVGITEVWKAKREKI